MGEKVYSFDVFDTLITRKVATPKGIFALMQEELRTNSVYSNMDSYVCNNFFHIRSHAEAVARNTYVRDGIEDVTLEQIYEAIGTVGNLSESDLRILLQLECRFEEENAVGIPKNIRKVKELLEEKKHIILISDMYLNETIIRKILVRVDRVFEQLPLYVSSDYRKGKWTGNLYEKVQKLKGIDYNAWYHFGDNVHSDIQMASNFGIKAEQYFFERLIPIEEKVIKEQESNAYIQIAIGTSRNTRLDASFTEAETMGASIGGIILFPYVFWIIEHSIRKGIARLYFIARDGYILKQIADSIIEEFGYSIRTYYIYGSRSAWRMPAICNDKFTIMDIYHRSYADRIKTLEELADFFQIPLKNLRTFIPNQKSMSNKKLKEDFLKEIVNLLVENEIFMDYLSAVYYEKRKRVVTYLQQELDISDDRFAFVDLAGTGFTQGCLAEIMSDFYVGRVKTFFYRMDQTNIVNNCDNFVFFPNYIARFLLLEMLCRAPHGQTVDYHIDDSGRAIPVFSETDVESIVSHGIPQYIESVKQYTKKYAGILREKNSKADQLELLIRYLQYVINEPDQLILNFIGDMPNTLTGREKTSAVFAPVLTKRDIKNIFLLRTAAPIEAFYTGSLLGYSRMRCSHKDNRRIAFYEKYHDTLYGKAARRIHGIRNVLIDQREIYATRYDLIAENIVIYAAGKGGQLLYQQLKKSNRHHILLWVDSGYEKYQKQGLSVSDPEEIKNVNYEQVIIAVWHKDVAEEIREKLIKMEVLRHMILWVPPVKE